jgi:hypothetical protein
MVIDEATPQLLVRLLHRDGWFCGGESRRTQGRLERNGTDCGEKDEAGSDPVHDLNAILKHNPRNGHDPIARGMALPHGGLGEESESSKK